MAAARGMGRGGGCRSVLVLRRDLPESARLMSLPTDRPSSEYDLVVAGGGAAGFFGAITAAEAAPGLRVAIFEKSNAVLGKVKISGGGRCNATHSCFDPKELVRNYPRGSKSLIGPFHRWGPADTVDWFEGRGVVLKTEDDGRMFPESDDSQSIIDCLVGAAEDCGVEVLTRTGIKQVGRREDGGFEILLESGRTVRSESFLLTTGGTRSRIGADIAGGFGHSVVPAAPSLFTFKIHDPRLDGLQGLAVPGAVVTIPDLKLSAKGPVLVTHWGLSGPGILRVSAWGARELHEREYRFEVGIDWTGGLGGGAVGERLDRLRVEAPKRLVTNSAQFGIPSRMWVRLVETAVGPAVAETLRWPHLTQAQRRALVEAVTDSRYQVQGKSMNKDEFVTCGGVSLREVNFKTMESKLQPGLYFAGEVLDIDGITGGFNFQAAWTTARIAGEAIAAGG